MKQQSVAFGDGLLVKRARFARTVKRRASASPPPASEMLSLGESDVECAVRRWRTAESKRAQFAFGKLGVKQQSIAFGDGLLVKRARFARAVKRRASASPPPASEMLSLGESDVVSPAFGRDRAQFAGGELLKVREPSLPLANWA